MCILQVSALDVDIIEVDPDTKEMLKSLVSTSLLCLFVLVGTGSWSRLRVLEFHPLHPIPCRQYQFILILIEI